MSKINQTDNRAKLIKEILNKKEYYEGILLKDLYTLIEEHPQFNEAFDSANINNKDQWKHSTRAMLQFRAENMKHFKNKDYDFYYLGGHKYTSTSTEAYKKAKKINGTIKTEFKEVEELNIPKSEKRALVKIRLNQGLFRKKLIKEINEEEEGFKSPIKLIETPSFLIASHIVAYADCETENDAANPENGLLLAPDIDKLFDKEEITFDHKTGKIIFIGTKKADYKRMGISEDTKLPKRFMTEDRKEFLKRRNDEINREQKTNPV